MYSKSSSKPPFPSSPTFQSCVMISSSPSSPYRPRTIVRHSYSSPYPNSNSNSNSNNSNIHHDKNSKNTNHKRPNLNMSMNMSMGMSMGMNMNMNMSTLSHWILQDPQVPALPFMYPLQSHVIVYDMSPSCIAQNIEACLKKLSVTAYFDNEKAMAHAQTRNHIHFNIRLFVKNQNQNHHHHPNQNQNHCISTIVELNRLSTPQLGFHQIVLAIFQSAQGIHTDTDTDTDTDIHTNMIYKRRKVHPIHNSLSTPKSTNSPSTNSLSKSKYSPHKIATESLIRVAHLLNKDRYDANALGMESMVFLTNLEHSSQGVAQLAAKFILCDNEDNEDNDDNNDNDNDNDEDDYDLDKEYCEDYSEEEVQSVKDKIYNLVMHGKMNWNDHEKNEEDDEKKEEEDEEECDLFVKNHYDKMRSDALTVLIHSLETISTLSNHHDHDDTNPNDSDSNNSSSLDSSLDGICCDMWLEKDLTDVLLNDVRSASRIPHGAHTAHLAVKCLHMMHSHSSVFRSRILDRGVQDVQDVVLGAICAGHGSHDLLAKESECFMSCLKCI